MLSFKRALIIIMIICMSLPSCVIFAQSETSDDSTYDAVELMEDLGVYTVEDDMMYTEDYITRENFSVIALSFYGISREMTESGEWTGFSDIPADYWASYYIKSAVNMGIMAGFQDGSFKPSDNLTYAQAIKAVITILGYNVFAQQEGGWPAGYFNVAAKYKLTEGMSFNDNDYINKGQLTQILGRALNLGILEQTSYGEKGKYLISKNKTLLNDKFDVYDFKGIVKATDITSLQGEDVKAKGYAKIGGLTLKTKTDISGFIGMYVHCYYKSVENEDNDEIIYMKAVKNKNKIVEIKANDILQTTNLREFFYEENGTNKSIDIPINVTLIFNGKRLAYFSENHLKPVNGSVKFLDADNNGEYEIIIVESYLNYWLSGVNVYNDVITLTDKLGNSPIIIDTNDNNVKCTIKKNNDITDVNQLTSNIVVSIAADKMSADDLSVQDVSTWYQMLISENTITGALDELSTQNGEVAVKGSEYNLIESYDYIKYPLTCGEEYKYYLNSFGEIVAAEFEMSEKYGFLVNAAVSKNLSKAVSIRVFTSSGEFENLECDDKVDIDGKNVSGDNIIEKLKTSSTLFMQKASYAMTNSNNLEQLLRFKKNSRKKIIAFDTIITNYPDNAELEKNCFQLNKKLDASENHILRCFPGSSTIEGGYGVKEGVILFQIPSDREDEDGFGASFFTNHGDTLKVPIYLFDTDEFNVSSTLMKFESQNGTVEYKETKNMIILDKITSGLNNKGENVRFLYGVRVKDGSNAKVTVSEKIDVDKFNFKPGDIVRWTESNAGIATVLEKAASVDGTGTIVYPTLPATSYYSDFRLSIGKVERFDNKYLKIFYESATPSSEVHILKNLKNVFVFDRNNRDLKIIPGSLSQIKTIEDFGLNNASVVFTVQNYTMITSLVIYR